MKPQVVDISHWQGDAIDFEKVKASGIVGVTHKATDGPAVYDAVYDKDRAEATAAGLAWGAYHVLRPGDTDEQVTFFLKHAKPDARTLLVVAHDDAKVTIAELWRFLSAVHAACKRLPVVRSGAVLKKQLGTRPEAELSRFPLWLTYHATNDPQWPPAWAKWFLWEYTDQAGVPGISSPVSVSAFAPGATFPQRWAPPDPAAPVG